MKKQHKIVQLIRYAEFCFVIILSSYSVKSNYFDAILNLLGLLGCTSMIFFSFTIQLLSIVTEKRGGKKRAKNHRTGTTETPSKLST